jgi:hypothetical protein
MNQLIDLLFAALSFTALISTALLLAELVSLTRRH